MHLLHGISGGIAASLVAALSLAAVAPVARAQQADRVIRCESSNGQFNRCMVPWRDAQLVRQESKGACIRGQSWGVDRQGLWVDRGCRGQFAEVAYGGRPGPNDHGPGNGGWRPGPGWDRQIQLQCDSNNKRYNFCQVDVGAHGRARLVKQLSDTRCSEGYSWGWNRAGVWADHGCRGVFVVDRRW